MLDHGLLMDNEVNVKDFKDKGGFTEALTTEKYLIWSISQYQLLITTPNIIAKHQDRQLLRYY